MANNDNNQNNDEVLLTRKEASKYLNVPEATLRNWAYNKKVNLKMVKIGKLVRYPLSGLKAFLRDNAVNPIDEDY